LFGPLAIALLAFAVVGLAQWVPGYSQVHQTVSEIGEMDSPARVPFALTGLAIAACIGVFASGLRRISLDTGHSTVCAYLTACLAVSMAGVAIFAFPHPLHSYFGLSELVGYQAPLAMALAWRTDPRSRGLAAFSWIMAILMWLAILANVSTIDRGGALWAYERPVYGLVQRSLFVAWGVWCTGAGIVLYRRARSPDGREDRDSTPQPRSPTATA